MSTQSVISVTRFVKSLKVKNEKVSVYQKTKPVRNCRHSNRFQSAWISTLGSPSDYHDYPFWQQFKIGYQISRSAIPVIQRMSFLTRQY